MLLRNIFFLQTYGFDYFETLSYSSPKLHSIVFTFVANLNLQISQLDIKNAFLCDDLYENVYIEQSSGYVNVYIEQSSGYVALAENTVYKLKKTIYEVEYSSLVWKVFYRNCWYWCSILSL